MFDYIKFFHYYVTALIGILSLLLGGYFIIAGFAFFLVFYVLGDAFLGDDTSEPNLPYKSIINALLYSAMPITLLLFFTLLWLVTPGNWALMEALHHFTGYDFYSAKEATTWWQLIIAIPFFAFLFSGVATVVAHELVHRLDRKIDVCAGRWLMSMSLDPNFSIEHVFNHHAKVATPDDPVSAPRGRNVYTHFVKALWGTNVSSWNIEKKRLQRKNSSMFSIHNQCIRGYAMVLSLIALSFVISGIWGGIYFMLIGLTAKFILEVVNYMEHYGLVRDPREPVRPDHSWNTNRRVSCWSMFNLPRHSHHHAQASAPFERLKAMQKAPTMIAGYISTIGIALIPPLWFRLMQPKLDEWDKRCANDKEKQILEDQKSKQPRSFFRQLVY